MIKGWCAGVFFILICMIVLVFCSDNDAYFSYSKAHYTIYDSLESTIIWTDVMYIGSSEDSLLDKLPGRSPQGIDFAGDQIRKSVFLSEGIEDNLIL